MEEAVARGGTSGPCPSSSSQGQWHSTWRVHLEGGATGAGGVEGAEWEARVVWAVARVEKIQQMGARMGPRLTPSKPGFQDPISMSNIIEVHWWCFGDKKTCGMVVLRAYLCCLCQYMLKTEAEHPPRPPGASISPQILPVA